MTADAAVIASADDLLVDAALRWCAAAGAATVVVDDPLALRREWRDAALVLLGDDLVPALLDHGAPSRREHVLLVAHEPDRWWRSAVELGAAEVVTPGDDAPAVAAVGAALDGHAEGCTIAVVGGSGGVGATTFAAALAGTAVRRGHSAVLVDADPSGPGVDLVLGAERSEGLRWPDLEAAGGRVSAGSLSGALPRHGDVALVAWPAAELSPVVPATAATVLGAATRAFDVVVVDAPVGSRPDGWTASVLARSVLTVVVVGEDIVSLAAARRRIEALDAVAGAVAVVSVRRRRGLGAAAVEEALGRPVVARLRPDPAVTRGVDLGRGPRSRRLRGAAGEVLELVGLGRGSR